jgi:hypothetical protein
MRQAFMKEFMTRKQARPWPVMCSITCGPFYIFCRVTPGGIIQPTSATLRLGFGLSACSFVCQTFGAQLGGQVASRLLLGAILF